MPRPPLPLGTYGAVRTYQLGLRKWRAVANYKDYDGITRQVEKIGTSDSAAANSLRRALRDRARKSSHGEITADSKITTAAHVWLTDIDWSDKAVRTKQEYRDTWNRYLADTIGALRVQDVRVSTVNRIITTVRDKHGRGAALHVRVVLSGIFGLCVRHDAMTDNPAREIESLGTRKRKKQRMVNRHTIGDVLGLFHASADAARWDLTDMIDTLSGLGCRIGELLALDWTTCIDWTEGTLTFKGTVIRIKGQGLIVQPHTKTGASMRTIRPPAWVINILKRRHAESTAPWMFPSATATLRDTDNTRKYIRKVVAGTPFEGLHPHDFRHYVADVLDRAGLTPREIADYIGHDRIATTQDQYMERGVVGEEAGPALAERPGITPSKGMG